MARAGVFIGVDKTGGLDKLNDAAAGAARMHKWALAQGIADKTRAKLITDAGNNVVKPDHITDAITEICKGAGVDQLIVYFAGHGTNLKHGDRWLLSEAPEKTYAAVNVLGSVELARMSGIPHVVFISDACRVAPEGIQNQLIDGVEIFPGTTGGDKTKPVDQFFACLLGTAAAEVQDAKVEAANYSALYTDALLDALRGAKPELLEPGDTGESAQYIRPWKLHDYLVSEIPARVRALKLQLKVNQNPDSIIVSRPPAWVSRVTAPVATTRGIPGPTPPAPLQPPPPPPPPTLRTISRDVTTSASEGRRADTERTLKEAVKTGVPGAAKFARTLEQVAEPFGPPHFESQCGIKVRGGRIAEFLAPFATGTLLGNDGNLLRIDQLDRPGVSVVLRFDDRTACVVPVVPGFIAALTRENGDLIDVAYEPSDNTDRWLAYQYRAREIRELRALAASASQHGRFRLDPNSAQRIGQQMQYAKGTDPTLAIYAAYAYHDLQLDERILGMSSYLKSDIGVTFFDLELLGRQLIGKTVDRKFTDQRPTVPFVPMLSQGWSLLRANRTALHHALQGIEKRLRPSVWTQFDATGADMLAAAIISKEVR